MSNLINRQDAIEAVMNTEPVVFDVQTLEPHQKTKDVIAAIEAVPSAQPEHKKGKWIDICDGYTDYVKCDQCGGILDYKKNFCPNCGADMRGEEE